MDPRYYPVNTVPEPSAPTESSSETFSNTYHPIHNQQNLQYNRRPPPLNATFLDTKSSNLHQNVAVHSPTQGFNDYYTSQHSNEENERTKELVRWKDELFSGLFVGLTFLCTCILVWSAWWTATALGEQPSICSVKQGIQVPSTVSFAPAFEFKTHQVPTHYTKGGWPVKNSGLRLSVGCLGVVAAFVWAGGVGRLNKKLSRQIYLPLFACILSLSVACIVYDANSLLSVNTSQCPSGELYSIVNSFKGYDCSCHTGAIFWATLGQAASAGANIILLQELFATRYFCQEPCEEYFSLAISAKHMNQSFLSEFQSLAKEWNVVLPVSFFERCNQVFYNSVVVFDADGSNLGIYRKSHIPESPGYYEKFYFSPGDTGFRCFSTRFGIIGVGICWDQWFPECARILALQGADILLYPTAIGSEPQDAKLDSRGHWQRTMQGHAAANMTPVIASNRVGVEYTKYNNLQYPTNITFYGSSFITDATGEIKVQADTSSETFICHTLDIAAIRKQRAAWGLFRDRRPELYSLLGTRDGQHKESKDKVDE